MRTGKNRFSRSQDVPNTTQNPFKTDQIKSTNLITIIGLPLTRTLIFLLKRLHSLTQSHRGYQPHFSSFINQVLSPTLFFRRPPYQILKDKRRRKQLLLFKHTLFQHWLSHRPTPPFSLPSFLSLTRHRLNTFLRSWFQLFSLASTFHLKPQLLINLPKPKRVISLIYSNFIITLFHHPLNSPKNSLPRQLQLIFSTLLSHLFTRLQTRPRFQPTPLKHFHLSRLRLKLSYQPKPLIQISSLSHIPHLQITFIYNNLTRFIVTFIKSLSDFFSLLFTYLLSRLLTSHTQLLELIHALINSLSSTFIRPYQSLYRFLNKPRRLPLWFISSITVLMIILASIYTFYFQILKDLPNPSQLASTQPSLSTKIYDRNGVLLYKIYKNENRTLVPLSKIPAHLIQATIAIEDKNFYSHPGFSVIGISRALKANVIDDSFQGGSTITQQLIKNTLLTPERTLTRKIKELILSFLTEFYYSKDEILTMYFNQVPYGGTAYGVQEASRTFFNKDVNQLNLSEAALLAGLPAAPSRYSPYGPYPEFAHQRQAQVLRRMVEEGYISQTQAQIAQSTPLQLNKQPDHLLAPHFVMYVRDELAKRYGPRRVEQGGLEVTTTLDLGLQQIVESVVRDEITQLQKLKISNGAALVTNPKTGEVLAMVGSKDYFDVANDGQVNVTLRPRQPGSSIKPINYAMALERGLTPASLIPDTPICYRIPGQPDYCPKNYDGQYHGLVTIRQALANSYNVPAVKILSQFGVKDMIAKGQQMGITTWSEPSRFGLSLTLGGGEVKMADMAVVYASLANQGLKVDLNPFLKIIDYSNQELDLFHCSPKPTCTKPQRVLDPRVAYQITNILSDNQARSQAFGTNSVLHIPNQEIAVKTGTTNSLRDNWTIGFTTDRLVAVWVGNNDNTPMSYVASGITGASPIWNKIFSQLLDSQHPHTFTPPSNLNKVAVCTLTGQLSCNGCPSREEYFLPGTEPQQHCSSEQIARLLNPTPVPAPQQTAAN